MENKVIIGSAFNVSLEKGCILLLERYSLKNFLKQSSISKVSDTKRGVLFLE